VSLLASVAVYAVIVVVLLIVAIWIGMLLAPRLGRLMDSDDEGPGDDD
jgi:hypothetical protein